MKTDTHDIIRYFYEPSIFFFRTGRTDAYVRIGTIGTTLPEVMGTVNAV